MGPDRLELSEGWQLTIGHKGCNVGYAFVNFISVEDLLHFTKARLGVKWFVAYSLHVFPS